jgi:hypothetical protein
VLQWIHERVARGREVVVMAGLWACFDGCRDPRLAWFASGGRLDGALPPGPVPGLLECLALPYGPEDVPFAGATHDEAARPPATPGCAAAAAIA